MRRALWTLGVLVAVALGFILRLKGIHNPLLDHPGWRQGDEASIARNFAALRYNIFYPQTNYDGPPPNYVELELQIVPFLAATFYKMFGVHEIAGRIITILFSLGTVAVLALFGRWLFASATAGILAALFYAVMPGSVYYGRTFTPDTAMVFFMTAALYAAARLLIDRERWRVRDVLACAVLLTLALLAKPVAAVAIVPILVLIGERAYSGRTFRPLAAFALVAGPLLILWLYDRVVGSHAEWHWASGILALHVLPALRASLQSASTFAAKAAQFRVMLGLLAYAMIGPAISGAALLGLFFTPATIRSRSILWAWLAAGLAYVFVVVTVERVDYYTFPLLPLAALAAAGFMQRLIAAVESSALSAVAKYACAALAAAAFVATIFQNHAIVKPYYRYSKSVYRNAIALDRVLPPAALVVMGHYDPSVLYYIARYGWEEDPYLWTPFDEQSAIRKGARYFIAIERNRFNRNVELCAWMQRFPLLPTGAQWPVYVTDPKLARPHADEQWRAFRNAEKNGRARDWLDAHGLCTV
jgi:4-amino-4-deoxy-L-arabinose transferase-like glycosyltransferase